MRVAEDERVVVIVLVTVFVAVGDGRAVSVEAGDIVAVTLCVAVLLAVAVLLVEAEEVPVREAVEERDTAGDAEEERVAVLDREPVGVEEPVLEEDGLALAVRDAVLVFEPDAEPLGVREAVAVREAVTEPEEDFVFVALPVAAEDTLPVALAFEERDAVRVGSLDREGLDDRVELRVEVALCVGMAAMAASSRVTGDWTEESPAQSNG